MKRSLFLAFLILLVLWPAACQSARQANKNGSVTVYYLTGKQKLAGEPLVIAQPLALPHEGADRLQLALNALFAAPETAEILSAFPDTVTLLDYGIEEGVVTLHLSDEYAGMTGIDLTLADACTAMTLCGLPDINGVRLLAGGGIHPDRPDKVLSADDISLDELSLKAVEREIVLYFKDSQNLLSSEPWSVVLRENQPLERYCLEGLIVGPSKTTLLPVLPPQTQFLSVVTERGVCYVNMPHEFFFPSVTDDIANRLTLYAIVNTLTQLPDVSAVQFLSEGEPAYSYGNISVSDKLYRDETLINR